ncbi:hypothetical protein BV898_14437 [Hypsibius exemplaris]|uniref:Uncharacterized protein n=1 Tax=Hypsibius exemplaris TaxID=2072580 RepID=A0A9X6N8W7_HYPEX|nr:hypothetical protein BV898_14437 [Hypsibius exemplaris]
MDSCFEARVAVFLVMFLLVPSTIQPNGTTTTSTAIPVPPDIMTKTTTTVVIPSLTNSTDDTTRMAETVQSSIVAASTNAPATNATTTRKKKWKRKTTTTPRPPRIHRPMVTDPHVEPTKWPTTTPIPVRNTTAYVHGLIPLHVFVIILVPSVGGVAILSTCLGVLGYWSFQRRQMLLLLPRRAFRISSRQQASADPAAVAIAMRQPARTSPGQASLLPNRVT